MAPHRMGKAAGKGFTLVEIMIVVAIIGTLAAIAVPALLRAKHNANEAAAIGTLETISKACEAYRARAGVAPPGYPSSLHDLISPGDGGPEYLTENVDTESLGRSRQGYNFIYHHVDREQYWCVGAPANPGRSGTRRFYVDETGVVRGGTQDITTREQGQALPPI